MGSTGLQIVLLWLCPALQRSLSSIVHCLLTPLLSVTLQCHPDGPQTLLQSFLLLNSLKCEHSHHTNPLLDGRLSSDGVCSQKHMDISTFGGMSYSGQGERTQVNR